MNDKRFTCTSAGKSITFRVGDECVVADSSGKIIYHTTVVEINDNSMRLEIVGLTTTFLVDHATLRLFQVFRDFETSSRPANKTLGEAISESVQDLHSELVTRRLSQESNSGVIERFGL